MVWSITAQRKRRTSAFAADMETVVNIHDADRLLLRYITAALTDGTTITPTNAVWQAYGQAIDRLLTP